MKISYYEMLGVDSFGLAELRFGEFRVPKVLVKLPCKRIQQKRFSEPDLEGQDYWKISVFERVDPFC